MREAEEPFSSRHKQVRLATAARRAAAVALEARAVADERELAALGAGVPAIAFGDRFAGFRRYGLALCHCARRCGSDGADRL